MGKNRAVLNGCVFSVDSVVKMIVFFLLHFQNRPFNAAGVGMLEFSESAMVYGAVNDVLAIRVQFFMFVVS